MVQGRRGFLKEISRQLGVFGFTVQETFWVVKTFHPEEMSLHLFVPQRVTVLESANGKRAQK